MLKINLLFTFSMRSDFLEVLCNALLTDDHKSPLHLGLSNFILADKSRCQVKADLGALADNHLPWQTRLLSALGGYILVPRYKTSPEPFCNSAKNVYWLISFMNWGQEPVYVKKSLKSE